MPHVCSRWFIKRLRYLCLGLLSLVLYVAFPILSNQPGVAQVNSALSSVDLVQAPVPESPSQLLITGKAKYQEGQFRAAISLWQQALELYTKRGDRLNQAAMSSNLALAYKQLGQFPAANAAIATSLSLLREKSSQMEKQRQQLLAEALNIRGTLQLTQGQTQFALKTWEETTRLYEQLGDQRGMIESLINQSQALRSLGLYPRARTTLQRVQTVLKTESDRSLQITSLLNLGNALRLMGDLEQATQALQQSLELAQEPNQAEVKTAVLMSLGNIARTQANMMSLSNPTRAGQDRDQALLYYQQAAEISTRTSSRIQALLNQQTLLLEMGNRAAVQSLLSPIRSTLTTLPLSQASVHAYIKLAQNLIHVDKQAIENKEQIPIATADIAPLLVTAVQQAKQLGDIRAETYAVGYLGELYEQTKQLVEAQQLTEKALILAQQGNASDIVYRWQWQLGRLLQKQWEASGRHSSNLQSAAIAAYTGAVETLSSIRNDLVSSSPDIQFSFRESVEPVYRELVGLLLADDKDQNQDKMKKARGVIESLQLAELDNFFREACLSGKPTEIDKIDKTAAVIYPIILPDRLEVVLSLPDQRLYHYPTRMPQPELEEAFFQMRRSLRRTSLEPERLAIAQKLYDLLIRPAEPVLEKNQIKTLAFVLDGSLKNIPIAALHDGKQYLLEKYGIAITPGLQLLSSRSLQPQNLRILLGGISESREDFIALPGVKQELAQIQQKVPSSEVMLNGSFTSDAFQQKVSTINFPVVHLATHGLFSSNADNTFILAWDRRIDVRQLGEMLQNRESASQEPIELLVLSACQTALGDKRAALGLAGVAVRSGARSTLASLWSVEDTSTSQFMVQFYQALAKPGIGKAEALRQTQIAMMQDFPHPYYWASFILVGNWL